MYFGSNFHSTYKQNWKFGFGSDLFKNINSSFDADFEKQHQFKLVLTNNNQSRRLLSPKVGTCPTYKKYTCSILDRAQNVKNLEL
jgi:hypothetical protein